MSAKLVVEQHRIFLDPALVLMEALLGELDSYKGWTKRTGYTAYEADWRDPNHPHDNLVMAMSMICWFGEQEAARGVPLGGGIPLFAKAIEGMVVPHRPDDRPRRPLWDKRTWAEELPPSQEFDFRAWDEAKRRGPDGKGPFRPELH
jgi:hypothetical protein